MRFFHTLLFQITAALMLMMGIYAAATGYTLYAVARHSNDSLILNLAVQLQLTSRRMVDQARQYKSNAPRDYETYHRDVQLYFKDLMSHVYTFDRVLSAFSQRDFPMDLTGLPDHMGIHLDGNTREALKQLDETWSNFRRRMVNALGDNPDQPRLEWAAELVLRNEGTLTRAAEDLSMAYQEQVNRHMMRLNHINEALLISGLALSTAILIWFFITVIRPLKRAMHGFQQVAQGDFGHQIPVEHENELGCMTQAFNELSLQLRAILGLIDKIQQGSDLDHTLCFVWEEFRRILPLDWTGALFQEPDGTTFALRSAYRDGHPLPQVPQLFEGGPVLEQTLSGQQLVHLPDLRASENHLTDSTVVDFLLDQEMLSAILLPFGTEQNMPGVLVFAAREAGCYQPEQLELLSNIGHLVGQTLGKTFKLFDKTRLAAIGEFTSGIVHEVRNPLATISLALQHARTQQLPEGTAKRLSVADREAQRMASLLEEVLLYAKPLRLERSRLDLTDLLHQFLTSHQDLADQYRVRFHEELPQEATFIEGDYGRLTQVLLNLARNACEANPGGEVEWQLFQQDDQVRLEVHNGGPPIPAKVLKEMWNPFVTSKPGGSGLGLAICRRIVEAHDGTIDFHSTAEDGTRFLLTLPGSRQSAPDGRPAAGL